MNKKELNPNCSFRIFTSIFNTLYIMVVEEVLFVVNMKERLGDKKEF